MKGIRNPAIEALALEENVPYGIARDRFRHRNRAYVKDSERIARLAARLDAIEPLEWMRLAAFIDAEGTIRTGFTSKARTHCNIRVQIANTDPRLAQWLASLFGGKPCWVKFDNPNWRDPFYWNISSRHAEFVLRRVRPYLLLKGEQADLALAARETIRMGRNQEEQLTDEEKQSRELLVARSLELNKRGRRG